MKRRVEWKTAGWLLVAMIVIGALWDTWAVYPLRMLVVFFHELSHGVMAMLTGGRIVGIELHAQEGGLCRTAGGNRFLTLSAGYLGSLVIGGVLLWTAARTKADRAIMGALGAILLLCLVLWVRPVIGFGFAFAAAASAACLLCAIKLPAAISDYALRLIGLTSCLYAPLDIKSDILDRPGAVSDAVMLADLTHIPALVWGVLWISIASAAAGWFLLLSCRGEEVAKMPAVSAGE